jgi:hypothetical protein
MTDQEERPPFGTPAPFTRRRDWTWLAILVVVAVMVAAVTWAVLAWATLAAMTAACGKPA